MPSLQFPSTGLQVLSSCIYFFGVSLIAHCLSRRIGGEDFSSFSSIRQIKWPRLAIILVFFDSWLFLVSSGVMIFGVGLESHWLVCSIAIYLCVAFYATSKLLLYLFLVEKVHIVWSPNGTITRRLKSPIYIVGIIAVALYSVVIVLMVVGRNHYFREGDGSCVIGLKHFASVSLLAYDFFINVTLTGMFLYPLLTSRTQTPRVTRMATRTLIASAVSLTTSTINMLLLTLLHGHELGWVCLGAGCGVDVIVNAVALFWATSPYQGGQPNMSSGQGKNGSHVERNARLAVVVSPPGAADALSPTRTLFGEVQRSPIKAEFDSPEEHEFDTINIQSSSQNNTKSGRHGDGLFTNFKEITFGRPRTVKRTTSSSSTRMFAAENSFSEREPVQITVTTQHDSDTTETQSV